MPAFLKNYQRVSIAVSIALLIAFFMAMRGPFHPMLDGNGPDPKVIIAYFLSIALVAALAHSTLVSAFIFARKDRKSGKLGLAINGAAMLVLLLPMGMNMAKRAIDDYRFHVSPYNRMMIAIEEDSVANFLGALERVPAADKEREGFRDDVIDEAARMLRLDILQALKERGYAMANASSPQPWHNHVLAAMNNNDVARRQQKVATVAWLIEEAKPFGHSLAPISGQLFAGDFFVYKAFRDIRDPNTAGLFQLLVRHGGNPDDCDAGLCPLWYAARFGHLEHVNFLIAHGVNLDALDPDYHTTALGEAISHSYVPIAEALLKAGAKITHLPKHHDVVSVCLEDSGAPRKTVSADMLRILHEAGAYITEEELAASQKIYKGRITDNEWECARQFLRAPAARAG